MSVLNRTATLAAVVLSLSLPARSFAQTANPEPAQAAPGRVAIGFNAGLILAPGGGFPVFGPNITFNASRKRALQISSSITVDDSTYSRETMVLYAVQYRRTFQDQGDSRSYWTVGGVGLVITDHVKEIKDGYFPRNAHTHTDMLPPVLPVIGFGTEKFVNPHLAIRGDVIISFLVVRAAVGLSVPLGRLK